MAAPRTAPPSLPSASLPSRRPKRIPPPLVLTVVSTPVASTLSPTDVLPALPPVLNQSDAPSKLRPSRNLKKLSLSIPPSPNPSAAEGPTSPSVNSLLPPPAGPNGIAGHPTLRRPSVVSLPSVSNAAAFRRDEGESPSAPYPDGPIQVMPNIWIGTDDHAKDWQGLRERRIKSIINVAKELSCPFDPAPQPLRPTHSVSDLNLSHQHLESRPTYLPAHLPSGRPAFHYLKLPWSHGQNNLVKDGFPAAMSFVDSALTRGDGVLIHCQCGVSRSATLVIAIVMRAAALSNASTSPDIATLKGGGMHAAYAYVKEKSKWVGPNMSLIYQLLDYERTLQSGTQSPASSVHSSQANEDLDWDRRRLSLEQAESRESTDHESAVFVNEAKALDQEMEERNVARKASVSSLGTNSSIAGASNGAIWRSRYGFSSVVGRHRAGSTSSNLTTQSSMLSEDPMEEDDDPHSARQSTTSTRVSPSTAATEEDVHRWNLEAPVPKTGRIGLGRAHNMPNPPPSAPAYKTGFSLPPRLSFKPRSKHRPSPLVGILPPVPSSPVPATAPIHEMTPTSETVPPPPQIPIPQKRLELRKPALPSLHIRTRSRGQGSFSSTSSNPSTIGTPSQTLFVFPPSPTSNPATLMLTSPSVAAPFTVLATPRVSTLRSKGRTKGFISLGIPPTPTTAYSLVEVCGTIDTPVASRHQQ